MALVEPDLRADALLERRTEVAAALKGMGDAKKNKGPDGWKVI